jgi:hypothetical protein
MKQHDRPFWILLIIGIALRLVALNQPLVDSHLLRQVQTAAATKSLIEQPGFPLSSQIPWLGNLDARYIQELPLYNYLVIPVYKIIGHLDASGKLVSVALWALSFWLLQKIWRRILIPQQTFWANLLFVVAPVGVFYGQAFMPEMLVQTLAFGFIVLTLRYDENPTLARWTICATVGLLGLLVKLPEMSHLYLILAFLVFQRERWGALARPRYWIAVVISAAVLKTWGGYMDSVNAAYLPQLGGTANLRLFIGTLGARFHFTPWVMVLFYLGSFVIPGLAMPAACYGLWVCLRKHQQRILLPWLFSLAAFYLLWFGNTAAKQSYYNLVALAPLCALFGLGTTALLTLAPIARHHRIAVSLTGFLLVVSVAPGLLYLFKEDRQILAAAFWARDHVPPGEPLLFRPNHRWDMANYPFNAVLAYYSDHPTFVWTGDTPEPYRKLALERSRYAVVTLPQPPPQGLLGWLYRFRGADRRQPESTDWIEASGYRPIKQQDRYAVYKRE